MLSTKCYDQYGLPIVHLTQWDSNVVLKLYNYKLGTAPIVHFSKENDESSKAVFSTIEDEIVSVVVPNILLTEPGMLDVCVFQYDTKTDDGHVVRRYKIPIAVKPKPDDYEYIDNTDVIELSTLSARLEALIQEATDTINIKISELETDYNTQVQDIKDAIAEDVDNLDTSIAENRDKLESDITESRTGLEKDVDKALQKMLASVSDGSPRGIFSDPAELAELPAGVYLYINPESEDNGYAFWWDGTDATKLVYYAGMVVNDRSITYEMLTDELKHNAVETVVSYTLPVEDWDDSTQELDVSDDYDVTSNTRADVNLGSAAFNQLVQDGCFGINIENEDGTLIANAFGNVPTDDVAIQITLREVKQG